MWYLGLVRSPKKLGNLLVGDGAWFTGTEFIIQADQALLTITLAPRPNRCPGNAELFGDGGIVQTLMTQQDDLGSSNQTVRK